jgi:integrase
MLMKVLCPYRKKGDKVPKIVTPLSDKQIKGAKPNDKSYKLSDGNGLYLFINTVGSKIWRIDYTKDNKRNTISLGKYPEVSLSQARDKTREIKKLLKDGLDPSKNKKVKMFFSDVAKEWYNINSDRFSSSYKDTVNIYLNKHIFPNIGDKDIKAITNSDIIAIGKKLEALGYLHTLRKVLGTVNSIFRYALSIGYTDTNIAANIDKKTLFKKDKRKNYSIITKKDDLAKLLQDVEDYNGYPYTKLALQLLAHTFVRPYNIRFAKFSEFDLKLRVWTIPSEKMKNKKVHIVPLTEQVISIIKAAEAIKKSEYLFPSILTASRPISENTLCQALKRMGYTDIVSHSFRGIASTFLNENIKLHDISSDIIERQLSHVEKNSVKGAYNHAEYIEQRKELMRWWSNYLENVQSGYDERFEFENY